VKIKKNTCNYRIIRKAAGEGKERKKKGSRNIGAKDREEKAVT